MNNVKKYIKISSIWIAFILLYILLLTLLNFIGIMKYDSIVKMNFVVVALATFAFAVILGKNSSKKGYIEGLKFGGLISAILFLLNLILFRRFSLNIFLYYLIIIVSSTIGSMLGINLKKK